MAGDVNHDYHLVDPSPWPAVGSLAAFLVTFGAVFAMKPEAELFGVAGGTFGFWSLGLGFMLLLYTFFAWWKDVIVEGEHKGDHTPVVQIGLRYGMILFIASEVMFFVAWFWAFFDAAMFPKHHFADAFQVFEMYNTEAAWPPVGVETFDPWHLPFMNTLILLLSGTTVTWAHHAIVEGNREGTKKALWCTVLLGALFTCVQVYEYMHASFAFSGNIYGATFFMATGFHGFHVLVGTIFLAVCLGRLYKGHFKPDHHFGFEAAAWYWHFVDVVWLFLFLGVYIIYG
ncbi:cytochrome c oxidase subunit III [Kordiimonas sediminis]|uniref:Cytochrome c oxidase subunit 3 n=1 Tax=Kordiimonas sediminis TaxID=1735581 RepID=A0A919AYW1_9PROT|nr:cytochrome c oxidase subunit 3 [Kordiimonas sediminis]GHF30145.1 cytochrome c oxidase subunit III [Kordiimonas sediminis]